MNPFWLILIVPVSVLVGIFLASIFSAGKITDLETRIWCLKSEIEQLQKRCAGLNKEAQKASYDATASAWKAYDEVTASAQKAYDEATASAWKAYDEATAPAQKAYDEAIVLEAYNEAKAST